MTTTFDHRDSLLQIALNRQCVDEYNIRCTIRDILVKNIDLTGFDRLLAKYGIVNTEESTTVNKLLCAISELETSVNTHAKFVKKLLKTNHLHLATLLQMAASPIFVPRTLQQFVPTVLRRLLTCEFIELASITAPMNYNTVYQLFVVDVLTYEQYKRFGAIRSNKILTEMCLNMLKKRPDSEFNTITNVLSSTGATALAKMFY